MKGWRRSSAVESLIGEQTEIVGDLRFAGGLHVDGRVKGRVTSTDGGGALSVGASGLIEGNVRAARIVLNGQIIGDVHAQHVSLGGKSRVIGNVYYRVIQMAAGAKVLGQLVLEDDRSVAALTHPPADKS